MSSVAVMDRGNENKSSGKALEGTSKARYLETTSIERNSRAQEFVSLGPKQLFLRRLDGGSRGAFSSGENFGNRCPEEVRSLARSTIDHWRRWGDQVRSQ